MQAAQRTAGDAQQTQTWLDLPGTEKLETLAIFTNSENFSSWEGVFDGVRGEAGRSSAIQKSAGQVSFWKPADLLVSHYLSRLIL